MQLRVIEHGEVDSTNERAFAALADGSARHGDVHVATAQTAGRGRRGRAWHSPSDEGLYASLVVAPEPPGPPPAALTMAGGLAALDTVRSLGLDGALLEWPNDLVRRGAKLAGVLVESRGLDPTAPRYVVGIGLNVAQRRFPPDLAAERPVTSLRLAGLGARVGEARDALLAVWPLRVEQALDRDPRLAVEFGAALGLLGRRVVVRSGPSSRAGRLAGLDVEALRLDGVEGECVEGAGGEGPVELPLAHVTAVEPATEGA